MKNIECTLNANYNVLVEKNINILVGIVDATVFCGKQNIALRGSDDEEKGNLRALLKSHAKLDPIMRGHLESGDRKTMYLSPHIQNELIEICGSMIASDIVKACNKLFCFGFMADEATDAGTMEQMALCVRVYDAEKVCLREEFVGFSECKSTTGEALSNAFLEKLQALGINIQKMRGQGYDGASDMSGKKKGVQARIQAIVAKAVYTHCKAHCLNLAIILASMHAKNMMATVQTIAFAFDYSAKRLLRFQEDLETDPVGTEEMGRRTKLATLCETRWAARHDALHTFLTLFRTAVATLDEQANDHWDVKAAGYSNAIQQLGFIVTLVAVEHILGELVALSKMLQDKECDLIEATSEAPTFTGMLQAERADEMVCDALYEKSVALAEEFGIDGPVSIYSCRA